MHLTTMATKVLLCITLLVFLFNANAENESASEFFNNFKGSRKGDSIEGISEIKKYLQHFGYINSDSSNIDITSNNFDDLLESALKKYQSYFNLNVTGVMDDDTVSLMSQPRCGVPDFPTVRPDYTFFPGRPKWWTFDLTIALSPTTRQDAYLPIGRAFRSWSKISPFNFSISTVYHTANLKVSFVPRDGPGKILATGYAPRDGKLQFDQAENWVNGKIRYGYDIESVALHEVGHVLGLAHSDVHSAVMYPYFTTNFVKNQLQPDDIDGLKDLYNYTMV